MLKSVASGCVAFASALAFVLQDPPQKAPAAPALDPRIAKPDRITRSAPPPLPQRVVLPLPPDFVVAAADEYVPISAEHRRRAMEAITRGVDAIERAQDASGAWGIQSAAAPSDQPARVEPVSVAVTALALKAIIQSDPKAHERPAAQRAIAFILPLREPDGSFGGGDLSNYVTSTVLSTLAALRERGIGVDTALTSASQWLQRMQGDDGEGLTSEQDWYGGAGYGKHGRPDLSNTQMMLDALYDAGLSPDEPCFQKALAFLSRTQNLKETNGSAWAGDDGGFVYTAANGGESMSNEYHGEGRMGEKLPPGQPRSLRSYGSMTYAGFKSLLHAGLSADDVRVRAVFEWVRRHFTFEENPGMGQQGLYYYYHALSRALRVGQQVTIEDEARRVHNWREELIDALAARQREDGSWVNETDRWMEGEPVLTTSYAVLALEEALKVVPQVAPAPARETEGRP